MSHLSPLVKRPRILLVEDSQLEAKLAEDILSKHASCPEITWVKNGFEALEHLADSTTLEIDLILLDIQMYDYWRKPKKN